MPSWSEAVTSDSDFFSSKGKAKTAPYSQGTFFLGKMLKIDLFFFLQTVGSYRGTVVKRT